MDHTFNVEVAKLIGLPEAVFLQNMKFWTFNNLANKIHIIDKFCWTYNTHEAFSLILPYFSPDQIKRLIHKLINQGYIIKGDYNSKRYDKTGWYAFMPKTYLLYPELCRSDFINTLNNSTLSTPEPASLLIRRFRLMDLAKSPDAFGGIASPIPDNKPNNKPYIKSSCSSNDKKIKNEKQKIILSPVENQSNSYNPEAMNKIVPVSPLLAEKMRENSK